MGPLPIFILSSSTYTKCESEDWYLIRLFSRPGILKKPLVKYVVVANKSFNIQ
jgi:hypothetical protein